ncbi:hypothetical protein L5515_008688 [Caenorhabditis briggsae]|nr:hypothetical protein L5515_008688 [Caenorhabditis briggsae]
MAMFAGHFIYRYSTIDFNFRNKYFAGARKLFPFLLPFVCSIIWGFLCFFCYDETLQKSLYMRQTVLENYDVEITECAYISALFWPLDQFGNKIADFRSFVGVAVMQSIVGLSLGCVLYFGIKCYLWLSLKLKSIGSLSDASKSLQKQLLQALVIQTAIPFILMYIPAGMIFLFPMLNVELNLKYPVVTHAVAIYPAIDPLPTIFIIKMYRRGCIEWIKKLTCMSKLNVGNYLVRRSNTVNPWSSTMMSN